MKTISLAEAPQVVRDHLAAINNFDLDSIVAVFADDAFVNDNSREIRGRDAVRTFFAREFVGDSVTIEPVEVIEHYGDIIIRGRYDGTFDRSQLPEVLIMSNYLTIRENRIVAEYIIFNQPSPHNETAA
ncbi:nuclear transport factor 2 family protein [Mycetocola lacteus]|uniref:Nuclear transport factor 2 family protein n=1 Tax=Mycetocola lacteus TaxID=76637 RepID=A0A3L7AT54_9MICO|nr:nuclear transport factor 2 family protein [Mycetocola lacteus]RLP82731.1 nuclear transport factor 2 family protein [Mycetocola lacteus]